MRDSTGAYSLTVSGFEVSVRTKGLVYCESLADAEGIAARARELRVRLQTDADLPNRLVALGLLQQELLNGTVLEGASAAALYNLASAFSSEAYFDREAHAAFRLLMDKMAETKDDQQIAWCARTWLRHAIGRVSVTPREEDDISDLLLADEAPHRDVLLKDVAFMDLLVSEWLLKRRLDLATAWRCETLKLLTKVAQSPLLDWPLLLAALAVMAASVWWWQPLSLVMAIAWCLLVVIAPHFGRALTPRLLASVLIGWLALSTTGWAWEFASQREHATMCIVADVVVSILCFFYVLFGEIRRHVGWLDFRRGARIWLVGALHALATGLVGFAVVGGVVDAARGAHWYDPLLSSSLTILKLSPFALTIGLLTQTLWEREAVTEPL